MRLAKSQQTQERARNWTSYEAYNIILAKQTDIVADLCNLGNDFKKLVFSLWAAYLDKNEVAFNEDVQFNTMPKIQHLMLKRDYNFIVKGEKEMKSVKKKFRINKSKDENKEPLTNHCENDFSEPEEDNCDQINQEAINLKRKRQNSTNSDNSELNEAETWFENVLDKCPTNEYKRMSSKDKYEIFFKLYSEIENDENNEEEKRQLEQMIINEQVKLNLLDESNEEELKILNDKILMLKEQLNFSTYAKKIVKNGLFKKLKRTDKKLNFRDVNYMTSSKLIAFIYIAMRLLNYDIYLYDLIRWIEFVQIPFYNLNVLLPTDWQFTVDDNLLFTRTKTPRLFSLNSTVTALVNYLEIPSFPQPNIRKLIIRIANDLDLPDSLTEFICNVFELQIKSNPKALSYLNKTKERSWFKVPEYEVVAFGLILLNLKYLFCLNDYHEILLSEKLKSSSALTNAFIWSEWKQHINFKLECFKTYIYPNKSELKNLELKNYSMLTNYYTKILDNPKREIFERKLSYSMKMARSITKDVPKLFEKYIENELETELEIESNFYPFITFKKYINQNFKTRNDDELNKSFNYKKINYLFENDCENICIENPMISTSCKRKLIEQNNEQINFLFLLASNYLNCCDFDLITEIVSIEDHFFSDYYETVQFVKDVEKQKSLDLKNAINFIDDFATNEGILSIDEANVQSKEMKLLVI